MREKLETITHMGTSTKMKTELMRRNTDAPGAEGHQYHIISKGDTAHPTSQKTLLLRYSMTQI